MVEYEYVLPEWSEEEGIPEVEEEISAAIRRERAERERLHQAYVERWAPSAPRLPCYFVRLPRRPFDQHDDPADRSIMQLSHRGWHSLCTAPRDLVAPSEKGVW